MYRTKKLIFFSIFFVLMISLSIYPKETHAKVVVTVIPSEKQVVKGDLLEINVTVFENDDPVGNARIKLILSQLSTEFETTDFARLQSGVYQTNFNTTSLTIGIWSLTAEVQAGGDIHYGENSVAIVESQERETSENPTFLIISILGISIVAVGLVYWASTELLGLGKKKKKRKKK